MKGSGLWVWGSLGFKVVFRVKRFVWLAFTGSECSGYVPNVLTSFVTCCMNFDLRVGVGARMWREDLRFRS